MKAEDFSEDDVHKLFSDGLKRAKKHNGAKYTLADLERDALALGYSPKSSMFALEHKSLKGNQRKFDLDEYVPKFYATGIPPRKFLGPALREARLFPVNALSILVALGSVGKTSTVISIAAHIAAGKDWGLSELQKQQCLLFFVEEDQVELDRKFGAVTHDWKDEERQLAINGMRLISLKDRDPRLTRSDGRTIVSTGLSDAIIKAAIEFDAKLIVCDHLQGVTAGDLNISDTATMLAQEANRIVSETEAAVVFTAHTNKSQIKAENVEHGFTTGSLAFENAARQVTGALALPETDASKLGLESERASFIKLEMPKNSYGKNGEIGYMRKEIVHQFHAIAVRPYEHPIGAFLIASRKEILEQKLIEYLRENPAKSKNDFDQMSGKKGRFKASKSEIRKALANLIEDEGICFVKPTKNQRLDFKIPHQTKEVLLVK